MDKYIDFYGYGIKDKNFNNGWGDSKVLILRKNGAYGLGKSSTLGGSTQYVRFFTVKDAQNFIDNYIPTDSNLNGREYTVYKVKFNRPAELYDKKYKAYITTYNLPKSTQVAQYDKDNKLLKSAIRADDLTTDDMLMLMDQLGPKTNLINVDRGYDDDLSLEYVEWMGIENPVMIPSHPLMNPEKFKCTNYYISENTQCLVLSGDMAWRVEIDDALMFFLPEYSYDFREYIYDEHFGAFNIIQKATHYEGHCTVQVSLEEFKEFIRDSGEHSFKKVLLCCIRAAVRNLPLNKSSYEDTKQFFESMQRDVITKYNTIEGYYDEYTQTDILEDLY